MRRNTTLLAGLATLAFAAVAHAQAPPDPEEFTPEGYKFCGWRDHANGGWRMQWSDDLAGVYLIAFAEGMTCTDARRNILRLRYTQRPPYRPVRSGYRCKTLDSDLEYTDVRCVATSGPPRKFRFQGGA